MKHRVSTLAAAVAALGLGACGDTPVARDLAGPAFSQADNAPPAPLVSVAAPAGSITFWPYTRDDLKADPRSDPINLVFAGAADARDVRAALMYLNGDRTAFGFPDAFPFNCTWTDAMGDAQFTYGEPAGWVGNGIQLQCGDYDPLRFHLRLFDVGGSTLGGVHLDLLIPGTADHQVISWELPQQLVMVDLLRSGLLDPEFPLFPSDPINDAPSFRAVPAPVYNGLPVELRVAIGGPMSDVTEDWPLPTDGSATVFNVTGSASAKRMVARRELEFQYDQVIPKPVCSAGPFDYVYVTGPVKLVQQLVVSGSGNLVSNYRASGRLAITPVNPLTNPPTPIGETYHAVIAESDRGIVTDQVTLASRYLIRIAVPPSAPLHGALYLSVHAGPAGLTQVELQARCP
jgi:hypothetical protein